MTISKRDAKLLLILLGIVFLFVGYFAVYNPYVEKAELVQAECAELRPRLDELKGYYSNLEAYYAGIDSAADAIELELGDYPASVRSEDLIMYAIELRDEVGLDINSVAFSEYAAISALTRIETGGDGTYTTKEAMAYRTQMTLTGEMAYGELKDLADHVAAADQRTSLENVSISYNAETGELTGSATLAKYFITSGDEEYVPTQVPRVALGNEELFGTYETAEEPAE